MKKLLLAIVFASACWAQMPTLGSSNGGGGGGGGVSGSGTTGYLTKFTGASAIGDSVCDESRTTASILTCTLPLVVPFVSTGSGAAGCGSATGCIAAAGANTVAAGAANSGTIRYDLASNSFKCTANGGAEAGCVTGSSGGGGTRTIELLPPVGSNLAGADQALWSTSGVGVAPGKFNNAGAYAASATFSDTCGGTCTPPDPYMTVQFWIPDDYSSGLAITMFVVDGSGSGGHTKWAYGLSCPANGSAYPTSFTNTVSSLDTAFSGFAHGVTIAATAIPTVGCVAGQAAFLRVSRDNTVGSNTAAGVALMQAKATYISTY